jgi:hypothetical protein
MQGPQLLLSAHLCMGLTPVELNLVLKSNDSGQIRLKVWGGAGLCFNTLLAGIAPGLSLCLIQCLGSVSSVGGDHMQLSVRAEVWRVVHCRSLHKLSHVQWNDVRSMTDVRW